MGFINRSREYRGIATMQEKKMRDFVFPMEGTSGIESPDSAAFPHATRAACGPRS